MFNFEYKYKLGDCITFCERQKCRKQFGKKYNRRNYIEIRFDPGGCWSEVGMSGGRQIINLQFPSCLGRKGTIAHELMHALGFYHEQSRPDRNKYVFVASSNIKTNRMNNFVRKSNTKAYDHYDFSSVMHYGSFAFRNKQWGALSAQFTRTIYPTPWSLTSIAMQWSNWGRGVTIGQRIGLSFCDELKLRRFYSEPGIEGGGTCQLWTHRTCRCHVHEEKGRGEECQQFKLKRTANELERDVGTGRRHVGGRHNANGVEHSAAAFLPVILLSLIL